MSLENEASRLDSETAKAPTTRGTRRAEAATPASVKPAAKPRAKMRPIRTLAIFGAVAGMVATVALPAYAAFKPQIDKAVTLQQVAEDGAQKLVVASTVTTTQLSGGSYAATTVDELEKKKAEEAAAKRAKELAEQQAAAAKAQAASSSSSSSASATVTAPSNLAMVPASSGSVIWPLQSYSSIGDGFRARGGSHEGVDILAPAMTPIYAAADGVVVVSSEGYWGYGVAVVLSHTIAGQRVTTLYGHMTYGTRAVNVGDTVKVGQPIGRVGTTGRSSANHLHFEVQINGSLVDPLAWLRANAG